MPHLVDLTPGKIIEGNEGDRWIVDENFGNQGKITVYLKKLPVEEQLINEFKE